MFEKPLKKCLFTLCVDNYAPEITDITFRLFKYHAKKIGAEFFVIKDRKFPGFPPVYEKLQIYELAQEMGNDWNIFIDADALIHPDSLDYTTFLDKDTVAHNGRDVACNRWHYDRYFLRDGRHIGSCNWFAIASDWCIELWKPLDDLTMDEAVKNIFPVIPEFNAGVFDPTHLIDDYTLSRNIAKYGLKFKTLQSIRQSVGYTPDAYVWHQFLMPTKEKVLKMKEVLKLWRVD